MVVVMPIPTSSESDPTFWQIHSNQWVQHGLPFVAFFCIFLMTNGIICSYVYWKFLLSVLLAHFCINFYFLFDHKSSLYILIINSLAISSGNYPLPFGSLILLLSLFYSLHLQDLNFKVNRSTFSH